MATLLAVVPGVAQAVAFNGPVIVSMTPDRVRYAPGQAVTIPVVLANQAPGAFDGELACRMTSRGYVVSHPPATRIADLRRGGSQTVTVRFTLPTGGADQGYLVTCEARADAAPTAVDTRSVGVDMASDWATYARMCFVKPVTAAVRPAAAMRGLRAYGCNVLQFYDVVWKHHMPFNPGPSWPNLSNEVIDGPTLARYTQEARRVGAAPLVYTAWNLAFPDFATDGSGVRLEWGKFDKASCGGQPCGAAALTATPSNCAGFPSSWAVACLVEMDGSNRAWKRHWATQNAAFVRRWGFAGCYIDTLGDFSAGFRADGAPIDYGSALSSFLNEGAAACGRAVINNVSNGQMADVAAHARQAFYTSERHPEDGDGPTFKDIKNGYGVTRGFLGAAKAIDAQLYMDEDAAKACNKRTGSAANCTLGEPGMRYMYALFNATGVWNNNIIDGPVDTPDDPGFVSNIYVPGATAQLSATTSLKQAALANAAFGIAYEKLLRNQARDVDHEQPATVEGAGRCGSTLTGEAGSIYMIPKARPGFQMLSMINLCGLRSTKIQDRAGDQPAPPPQKGIKVKMYYANGVTGRNRLWLASPDFDAAQARQLAYEKHFDQSGTYIEFEVPTLLYHDFIFLELDTLRSSDYANT